MYRYKKANRSSLLHLIKPWIDFQIEQIGIENRTSLVVSKVFVSTGPTGSTGIGSAGSTGSGHTI
ncbi:hypothetical protein [Kordia sp.]|uniref:hypothetical protein n=1 Tax=Kordia sp. TaxID=1965332 RepID=UPI003D2ABBEE